MRIGTRLWLTVAPGVIGVVTVAALAYWGELGRQVPSIVVWVAAIATASSIALAWRNVRYVARRVERLAHEADEVRRRIVEAGFGVMRTAGIAGPSPDELVSLEGLVTRLAETAVTAERSAHEREAEAARRLQESGALLRTAAADIALRLDDVRLPLHILLENRFGDLNDNQEEMLGVARAATDAASEQVRRAVTVLGATEGALELRHDRIHGGELVDGVLVRLRTLADARHVRLDAAVDAPLPALSGDRVQLQEALRTVFGTALLQAPDGSTATLTARATDGELHLALAHGGGTVSGMPAAFAHALVTAHRGTVTIGAGNVDIRLPVWGLPTRTEAR
ncbi:MAG: hypothetical protein U9Q74_14055 [Gemmatimonadota bacterium]|nr:hypothetical protein [Gemmatimonadota bacterium]